MKIYFQTDKNNRLTGQGSTRSSENDIELIVSDSHEVLQNPFIFKYVDGVLVKDKEYQQQLIRLEQEQDSKPSLSQQVSELKKQSTDLVFEFMMKGLL